MVDRQLMILLTTLRIWMKPIQTGEGAARIHPSKIIYEIYSDKTKEEFGSL